MSFLHGGSEGQNVPVVEHFLACGEMLPSQLPSASTWSPEKKLAAAVLASALAEVRDRHADPAYRRRVDEDLEWIGSDDTDWPFAFVPLCQLFGLEPEYVRATVNRWIDGPAPLVYRQCSAHRHAA